MTPKVLVGCPDALTYSRFLGHLSATLFLKDLFLLLNKCALPPLHADSVHLSDKSFHTNESPCVHLQDKILKVLYNT